jgi:hypothetical protein
MAKVYFVGNGTNWSSTSSWSTASGGASGAAVPTAADDVVLDAASPGNLTIDAAAVCRSINCTGFTHTLTHAAGIILSIGDATAGDTNIALKFVSGMTYTLGNVTTSEIDFISTSATVQTVDFAGKDTGNVIFNAASNGSWQLTGAWGTSAINIGQTTTLTKGTLDLNGQTINWGNFASTNSNVRTLTMGSANVTLKNTAGVSVWDTSTVTNLTLNANTSTITLDGANANFRSSTLTFYNLVLSGTSENVLTPNASGQILTFNNLTRTGGATNTSSLSINIGYITVNGTFTCTGNTADKNRLLIRSAVIGSARQITAAAVSLSNTDFRDIEAIGTALPWTGTSLGDAGGNENITTDTPVTRYWVGNGGNMSSTTHWSTSSGGVKRCICSIST